ncbi:glycosyltransferase family 2 protein [Marinibacterium sp. SX1]|uniref:glycosyltransferase family 2 protein n=1 Tax=Marinibacterium sp. SX1 TaxID=3388424 RepID=UPI003D171889
MTEPTVSVVIVSRDRPEALARCLRGVAQQHYTNFEVVIVADRAGMARLWAMPEAIHAKQVRYDEANIAVARNLGIIEASGEVVAFIDDDAVPEPSWLSQLSLPFLSDHVTAAGGYVLGRNGISWQWRAQSVDVTGQADDIRVDPGRVTLLTPTAERGIKTQGTNMALRRSWLARHGGFDPGFRYFLDETDINLRLAESGNLTAVVPGAVVHHGFAANAVRDADRVPRDLFEIGASWAVFLDKHCPPERRARALARARQDERLRALRHMVAGTLEPRDVRRLMKGFDAGVEDGRARGHRRMVPLPEPDLPFRPYPARPDAPSLVVAGRPWQGRDRRAEALFQRQAGRIVTEIILSPSAWRHRVSFGPDGIWHQRGGLFGKSDRSDSPIRAWRFKRRIAREIERVRSVRLIERELADQFRS